MNAKSILRFAVVLALGPAAFAQEPAQATLELGAAPWLDPNQPKLWEPTVSQPKAVNIINPIATGSKQAVRSAYQTLFAGAVPAHGFTGSVPGCSPGSVSTALKEFTISRVNYYRAMAGLPGNVTLDANATRENQQQSASLLYASHNMLAHTVTNPPFTNCPALVADANSAGTRSNIALGSGTFTDVIPLFMDDPGSGNEVAGHRRWFLYPPQSNMAVGFAVGSSTGNAVRVFDGWGARPATPNGVAWPNSGFVPTQVLPNSKRWSYSFNGASFAGATVSITANGTPIANTIISSTDGYGDNTIVFVPTPAIAANTNYTVTVSGMSGGGAPSSYTYTVRTFDANATLPGLNGDFNANGSSDILFANTDGRAAIWLMNGTTPTATQEIIGPATGWSVKLVADFNGDSRSDLAWQHTDGRIALYLMNGTTATTTQQILNAGAWSVTHAPDLNGDGRADIVFQNLDGTVAVWTMNGTTMTSGATLIGAGTGWSVLRTSDFDGDGNDDLLWKHTDGRHAVWLMNGVAVKATAQIINAGGWTASHTPDLNGDGKADIVWRHTDGTIAAWLMNGTAFASGTTLLGTASGWSVARTADFNADGRADLLFQHTDGRAAIYLMNGLVPTQTTQLLNAGGGWSAKRLVDLNGDGRADIVWENVNGTTAVWLMNGTAFVSGATLLGTGTGWGVSAVSQ